MADPKAFCLLPNYKQGIAQRAFVEGCEVYLQTGEYKDGSIGELLLDVPREAPDKRVMVHNFAKSVSIGLQYGVPLTVFIEAWKYKSYGPVDAEKGSGRIQLTTSLLDYVFRELERVYLNQGQSVSEKIDKNEKEKEREPEKLRYAS